MTLRKKKLLNTVWEKGGNAGKLNVYTTKFPALSNKKKFAIWATMKLSSANTFKLGESKILSCSTGLTLPKHKFGTPPN